MESEFIQAIMDKLRKLEDEVQALKTQRITQAMIIPSAIKTRHMGEPNRFFMSGLAADRPEGQQVGSGVTCYFATDTNTLSIWNGTAYVSEVLT